MNPVSVYVHIPFCPSKCGYCDFNSYAMTGEIVGRTTAAILGEIRKSPWAGRPAKTIFFGGGTPTFLEAQDQIEILNAITEAHPPTADCEITSEANPGTVDQSKFAALRQAGFNRISLGGQSFAPEELKQLGRVHGQGDIHRAVYAAHEAGFENINLDLMFALPGQTLARWKSNLDFALQLPVNHLSLYCLTIEPNTRFHKLHQRGLLEVLDDDRQTEMYDLAASRCAENGFEHYEISNFCKPGFQSRHNLAYWRCEEYLAYGPGAVGCFDDGEGRHRYTNLKHPTGYSEAVESGANLWCEHEILTDENRRLEQLMMGLRLSEGVSISGLPIDHGELQKLVHRGWLNAESDRLKLTDEGRHFCSEVALCLA